MSATRINTLAGEGDDLARLNEAASRIGWAESLLEVLDEAVEFVASIAGCDSSTFYVQEDQDLVLRASKNPPASAPNRLKLRIARLAAGWTIESQAEMIVIREGACQDARFKQFNPDPTERYEAFLSMPLIVRGQLVGVLNAQGRSELCLTGSATKMIATVASLVGREIARDHLVKANRRLSGDLETRAQIEHANRILQRQLNIGEDAAYTTMRRQSQQKRMPLKEIAKAIILSQGIRNSHVES